MNARLLLVYRRISFKCFYFDKLTLGSTVRLICFVLFIIVKADMKSFFLPTKSTPFINYVQEFRLTYLQVDPITQIKDIPTDFVFLQFCLIVLLSGKLTPIFGLDDLRLRVKVPSTFSDSSSTPSTCTSLMNNVYPHLDYSQYSVC